MAPSRCRLICFVLVLSILVSLVPMGVLAASATEEQLGKTTIDKVNVRVSDSNSAKLLFQIPNADTSEPSRGNPLPKKSTGTRWNSGSPIVIIIISGM